METPDGAIVELERYRRMLATLATFNPDGKDLRWAFAHLFESYAPPHASWFLDETIYKFGTKLAVAPEPILIHNAVSQPSAEEDVIDGVHWLREAP